MNHSLQIKVPGYRIERILGKGGMATVYLATQMSLGRPVALKVLHDPETPQFFERFFNEGRYIARLNHSNLIAIFDIGQGDGFYYIAMEYLPGGDLKSRIMQGLKPAQALKILSRLASCLAYVHGEGVIHRDIKPSNILFRNDGTPVLTDFGIAKLIQTDNDLTVTGTVMGSPHYLSPELAQGIRRVDGRSDLYSLGIILYEMLTGRKPYTADSFAATLLAHIQNPVPKLPEQFAELQPLLDKLLAKKPEDRFQNGVELLMNLQTLRSQLKAGRKHTAAPAEAPPAAPRRRWHWLAYGGAAGLILLAGLGLGLGQRSVEQPTEPAEPVVEAPAPPMEPVAVVAPASESMTAPEPAEAPDGEMAQEPPPLVTETAPAEPEPAPVDPEISKLLEKAGQRLATDRLSYPKGDSARFYYNAVLKKEPGNRDARRGLVKIADRYAELAQAKLDRGRTLAARRHISQGLSVQPRHERLIRMLNQLNRPVSNRAGDSVFDRLTPQNER